MPTCAKCRYSWTWKETMSNIYTWDENRKMKCPSCREKQYISIRSRRKTSIVTLLLLVIILLSNLVFGPSYIAVTILFVLIPVQLLSYPFFIRLTDKQNG